MDKLTGIHAVREALDAGRPFDRILIAQSIEEGWPLVTSDAVFGLYPVQVVW